jgi:hypothetical protein
MEYVIGLAVGIILGWRFPVLHTAYRAARAAGADKNKAWVEGLKKAAGF